MLTRLHQVVHGWANYLRFAGAKDLFSLLDAFAWRRVITMLMVRHHWRWKDVRDRSPPALRAGGGRLPRARSELLSTTTPHLSEAW